MCLHAGELAPWLVSLKLAHAAAAMAGVGVRVVGGECHSRSSLVRDWAEMPLSPSVVGRCSE